MQFTVSRFHCCSYRNYSSFIRFYTQAALSTHLQSRPTMIPVDRTMKTSKFEDTTILKHVQRIKNAAGPDVPALASEKVGWAMAWIHVVVWNAWKSVYFHADKYSAEDFENYRGYALLSFKFLVGHHEAEEETLFRYIDAKVPGAMTINEEQHQIFLEPLEKIVHYLQNVTQETFSATELCSQIDDILEPVMNHLSEELDTLEPSIILRHFSEEDLVLINYKSHSAAQQKAGSPHQSLPFMLQNMPPNSPFPPAPGFVKNILGPYVFYWKFSGFWKYAAYSWKPSAAT
ncbi:hypothetical protein C8J56DRAFT_969170 [Mycena floridula]|nr:hypothetical protein C8J56DRAFT_969170 [Mycena floridula]